MNVTLSPAQQAQFAATARALLSPLDLAGIDLWRAEVLRHLVPLIEADAAGFLLPSPGHLPYTLHNLPEAFGREFLGAQWFLDTTVANVQGSGLRVWSTRMLGALAGVPMPDYWLGCEEYLNFYARFDIQDGLGFAAFVDHAEPQGEAILPPTPALVSGFREVYGSPAFGERGVNLLRMLLPALDAGVMTAVRLAGAAATIQDILAAGSAGAVIVDSDRRRLYENPALTRLLEGEPERDRITAAMDRVVAALVPVLRARGSGGGGRPPPLNAAARELRTSQATYRLWATLVREHLLGPQPAVLVQLERRTPELPSAACLEVRWGLTRQQARVARLLARGRSNRSIASSLKIRESTARHYTEAVFRKLGVTSRAEATNRILSG